MNILGYLSYTRVVALITFIVCLPACWATGDAHSATKASIDLKALEGKEQIYPIVIIGSGPAGLASALYAGRGKAKTVVFLGHLPGGLLTETSQVENWPGIPAKMGKDIIKDFMSQVRTFQPEFWEDEVEKIDFSSWPYKITTGNGKELYAMTIIMATGARPRKLEIQGETEYWGKGVTTCAVCDAPFYRDKEVVVIGGGDSAVEEAMQLAQYAKKITILVRKDKMRAAPTMQELLKGYPHVSIMYDVEPREIKGNGSHVTAIALHNAKTKEVVDMPIDGVFLAIGHIPNSRLIKGKVALDEQGYIIVEGRTQQTSMMGVYAAGDVEDPKYRQAGVAAGHGIAAAQDALSFLSEIGFNTEVATKMGLTSPSHKVKQVTTVAELEEVISQAPLALVDFSDKNTSSSDLEGMLRHRDLVIVKVNIDRSKDIARKYFVFEAPVALVFKKGALVGRFNQIVSTSELSGILGDFAAEDAQNPLVKA